MHYGLWNPAALIAYGRKLICSKVYFDAHLEIAKLPLSGWKLMFGNQKSERRGAADCGEYCQAAGVTALVLSGIHLA
jgi:hypothetical protein